MEDKVSRSDIGVRATQFNRFRPGRTLKIAIRCLGFSFLLLVSGCANVPLGARFSNVESAPTDKALVYIYRPYTKASSAFGLFVHVDGVEKVALPTDAYTRLLLSPGKHALAFTWPAISMQIGVRGTGDFEKGKTYFLKYGTDVDFQSTQSVWTYEALYVEPARAIEEMKCCSFSQPRN